MHRGLWQTIFEISLGTDKKSVFELDIESTKAINKRLINPF